MLIKLSEFMKPSKALSRPQKGIVVDNNDPKKLRRVRVSIAGLLETDDIEKLPWVTPMNDSPTKFDVPSVGAELIIVFPYNEIYSPFYMGEWHNESNHDAYFDDGYPFTFGRKKEKIKAKFNDESGEGEVIQLDGMEIKLSGDGSVELKLTDLIQLLGGKLEVTATGDIKLVSTANVEVTGDGTGKFAGKGGTDIGDSASATNVDGSVVNIAGGGVGVALLGSQCIGQGNAGAPVVSQIIEGSSKVFASK